MRRFSRFSLACLALTAPFLSGPAAAASKSESPVGWASTSGGTTGGTGGQETTVETMSALNAALKESGKRIIWIKGTLTGTAEVTTGDKSILGLPGAKIVGNMNIVGSSSKRFGNVIVRNFEIEGPGSNDVDGHDALAIQYVSNIWVDHMLIRDGLDGNMDITNEADLVTVSWVKWEYRKGGNHAFCNLIGGSDDKTGDRGKLRVTFHNNWWADGVKERMPRVRFGKIHMVNNLFSSATGSHCIRAGFEADILAEGNAFLGVKNPVDLFEDDFKAVTMKDNLFDAGVTGNRAGKGTAFTPPYSITVAKADQVESLVKAAKGAGPGLTWDATTSIGNPGPAYGRSLAEKGNGKGRRISSGPTFGEEERSVQGRYLRVTPDPVLNSR